MEKQLLKLVWCIISMIIMLSKNDTHSSCIESTTILAAGKELNKMKYILSFIYWSIFAKIFLEVHRFVTFHFGISVFITTLLFFSYILFTVIILIPLSVSLAERTVDFIRSHWRWRIVVAPEISKLLLFLETYFKNIVIYTCKWVWVMV